MGGAVVVAATLVFAAPQATIDVWPWTLTPLTCRVVGAIFCLGTAGISALIDPRWTSLKLMLQVEALMVALILLAAARAHTQFDTGRPLTWLMLAGFVAVLLGSGWLWYDLEIRSGASTTG